MAVASRARRTTPRVRPTKSAPGGQLGTAKSKRTTKIASPGGIKASAPCGRLREAESPGAVKNRSPGTIKKAKPGTLVQRVYNTIDGELTKLEKQKGVTSQDRERASRALAQMVNALEKAIEMQREMTKSKRSGGDAKSKDALAHAEDLRREIAERLERLDRKRKSQRNSE